MFVFVVIYILGLASSFIFTACMFALVVLRFFSVFNGYKLLIKCTHLLTITGTILNSKTEFIRSINTLLESEQSVSKLFRPPSRPRGKELGGF